MMHLLTMTEDAYRRATSGLRPDGSPDHDGAETTAVLEREVEAQIARGASLEAEAWRLRDELKALRPADTVEAMHVRVRERLATGNYVREALERGAKPLPSFVLPLLRVFCGCGDPEAAWAWARDYLHERQAQMSGDALVASDISTGRDYVSAYLMDHLGYTEHGSSIHGCWLTDQGKAMLTFLDTHGPSWEKVEWIDDDGVSHGGATRW